MDTGQYIILGAYVVGYLATFIFQRQQIKNMKAEVESHTRSLDSVKKFMDIFDIDELKKYVEVIKEKAATEKELALRELQDNLKAVSQDLKDYERKLSSAKKVSMIIDERFSDWPAPQISVQVLC